MNVTESPEKSIFRHRFDTKKVFVTAKNHFSLRNYENKLGESIIYLDITDKSRRIRRNTDIYIPKSSWDLKKKSL